MLHMWWNLLMLVAPFPRTLSRFFQKFQVVRKNSIIPQSNPVVWGVGAQPCLQKAVQKVCSEAEKLQPLGYWWYRCRMNTKGSAGKLYLVFYIGAEYMQSKVGEELVKRAWGSSSGRTGRKQIQNYQKKTMYLRTRSEAGWHSSLSVPT